MYQERIGCNFREKNNNIMTNYQECQKSTMRKPSYTPLEKKRYLDKKSYFKRDSIGKFVIVQSTRFNKQLMKKLYLVDRNITKKFWWSMDSSYAKLFDSRSAAESVANRYRYNNVHVVEVK